MRVIIKDKPGNSDKSESRYAHGERQHIRRGRKDISEKVQEGRGWGVMKSRVKLGHEFPGRGDSFQVGKGADSYPVPFEILFTAGTLMKVLPNYCFCFTVHLVFVEFPNRPLIRSHSLMITPSSIFLSRPSAPYVSVIWSFLPEDLTSELFLRKKNLLYPSGSLFLCDPDRGR